MITMLITRKLWQIERAAGNTTEAEMWSFIHQFDTPGVLET